ncbi:nucleotide exchange factor GrpE [Hoylesella marshii]|jgi:grpE|uniref:Protein GrpE n=1 Tax=Hoylesella marshii DSM 16973 = JCM 13450 TaxID=862515 RepID=E0NPK2_9BACT|nr:nucleotide exchange factor GrpE [Hoylesella marshii]EFM02961.1 co-chaperone GrpE [Hoylesella marshii DSM 16973 = JCM 13450]
MKHQSKNNEKEINVEDGRRNEPECTDKQPVEEGQPVTDKSDGNDDSLEDMHAKIADLQDKYLRTVAEFDNYRKRTIKEKADLILSGSEKAVSAILPILDDMERAIDNAGKTEDVQALRDGLELIYKKFEKTLEGMGVKKIETAGKDFDTEVHEAVAMVPGMGDEKKGKVVDCVQTGYTLNDKVLRHAKVAVGQ